VGTFGKLFESNENNFLRSYTVVVLPLALTINRDLIKNSTPIRRIDRAAVKTQKSLKSSAKLVIILLLRA